MKTNEDSFKAPFRLNKRLYIGTYSDLNFKTSSDILFLVDERQVFIVLLSKYEVVTKYEVVY